MLNKNIALIDKNLKLFLKKARRDYKMHLVHPILFNSIEEFILRKGKRIRPQLMIYSYKGYQKRQRPINPSIYFVSTCIELLHNFMLIHDDIIDCSNLRRGKPTMHILLQKAAEVKDKEKLGSGLSIVAGDIVYAMAIDAFLSIKKNSARKEKALKYFIQTAVLTAMGEFVDSLNGVQPLTHVKEDDVLLNYSLKTARYTFDCPLVVGAILAGAGTAETKKLTKIGLLIGQAFQIQDDIIGIFDTQKNIGKSILSDLAEMKKTILVCHAYSNASKKQKKSLLKLFTKPQKNYSDLTAFKKILIETKSLDYSYDQLKVRLRKAERLIAGLRMRPKYLHLIQNTLLTLFKHSEEITNNN